MTPRRVAIGLALTAVLLFAMNATGLLRYPGGPLREPGADGLLWLDTRPADQGNNQVEISSRAGVGSGVPLYTGMSLSNDWPWPATIEQIRLLGATPGLRLVEARMALPGTSGEMAGAMAGSGQEIADLRLDTDYGPLPANLAAHNEIGEGRVSIEVTADQPGEYSYDALAVDYRVGPFTFTVVHHQAFGVCVVPLPTGSACSLD
jgi:hypothetical protein